MYYENYEKNDFVIQKPHIKNKSNNNINIGNKYRDKKYHYDYDEVKTNNYCINILKIRYALPTISKSILKSFASALTLVTTLRYNAWINSLVEQSELESHGELLAALFLTVITVLVVYLSGILQDGVDKVTKKVDEKLNFEKYMNPKTYNKSETSIIAGIV